MSMLFQYRILARLSFVQVLWVLLNSIVILGISVPHRQPVIYLSLGDAFLI